MRTKMCHDPVKSGGKPLFLTLEMVQFGTSLLPLPSFPLPLYPFFLSLLLPRRLQSADREEGDGIPRVVNADEE
jgi:hypothetical protein